MKHEAMERVKAVASQLEAGTQKNASQTLTKRKSPGRPRSGDPQGEGLREQVISAAAEVYSVHGYRDSSVDLIANTAGVSRPLFYRLFKNRREVIDVVLARANDALRVSVLQTISHQASFLKMLSTMLDVYFDWCRQHTGVAGVIYREVHDPESPAGFHRDKVAADISQLINMKMAEQGRAGLHPALFETLIRAIEHIGSTTFWPTTPTEDVVRKNRAVIERIVLATLATPEELADVPGLETVLA